MDRGTGISLVVACGLCLAWLLSGQREKVPSATGLVGKSQSERLTPRQSIPDQNSQIATFEAGLKDFDASEMYEFLSLSDLDEEEREDMIDAALDQWRQSQPEQTLAFQQLLGRNGLSDDLAEWATVDEDAAINWLRQQEDDVHTDNLYLSVGQGLLWDESFSRSAEWLWNVYAPPKRRALYAALYQSWLRSDAVAADAWLRELSEPDLTAIREGVVSHVD